MGIDKFDPNDPRIQIIVMKQQLKHSDELNTLQRQLDLKKQELMFLQEAINRSKKKASKQQGGTKLMAILANLLFLLSTIFIGFGVNRLTSTPPNSEGFLIIVLGSLVYMAGVFMTTILVSVGKKE